MHPLIRGPCAQNTSIFFVKLLLLLCKENKKAKEGIHVKIAPGGKYWITYTNLISIYGFETKYAKLPRKTCRVEKI